MIELRKRNKKYRLKKKILLFILIFIFISLILIRNKNSLWLPEIVLRDSILSINNLFVNKKVVDKNCTTSIDLEKEELEKEIHELKGLLEINNMLSDKVLVSANVVNRNIGYFYETITINKGKKDGIEEGMAVVVENGLIGKTVNVSNNYSDVVLLTSEQIGGISVKIKSNEDYAYGLLKGYDKDNNVYKIQGISEILDIKIGEPVTTTGMGDIFPSGILIGIVKNITTDHFDLTKIIEITPSVNIYDFSVVSVLKRNVNDD